MTRLAVEHSVRHRTSSNDTTGRIATRAKVWFESLICPSYGHGFYNLHTAQAFEVFRWMVATGWDYRGPTQWGEQGVRETLSLKSTCVNCSHVEPLGRNWLDDLRARFLHALFDPFAHLSVHRWRNDFGIYVDKSRQIPMRFYAPVFSAGPLSCFETRRAIDRLFSAEGQRLKASHNPCWPKAKHVQRILLDVHPTDGWNVDLGYGFKNDSSSWGLTVAKQHATEPFVDFIIRANCALAKLLSEPLAPLQSGFNRDIDLRSLLPKP